MKTRAQIYLGEIHRIFAYAAVFTYSWSMLVFFWDLPSYLLRFAAGDIIGILAYHLVLALIESAIVAALATGFALLSPAKADFSIAGALFITALAGAALILKKLDVIIAWLAVSFSIGIGAAMQAAVILPMLVLLGGIGAAFILPRKRKAKAVLKNFVENLLVLGSLYALSGFLAVFILIYRNMR